MTAAALRIQAREELTAIPPGLIPLRYEDDNESAEPEAAPAAPVIAAERLSLHYGRFAAVRDVSLAIAAREVTAIIGPSGCGKSTLLRAMNRMNDFIAGYRAEGRLMFGGRDIVGGHFDPVELRRRIGMVFQKPNPFPKSIYRNVAWGARINGYRGDMAELVERSLRRAAPWRCRADSSSGCASRARLRWSRRCC